MNNPEKIFSVDVHAIDEMVMNYYFDDYGSKIAYFDLSVEEAEKYINLLQEAIETAKKSEYYQKDES